MIINEVKPDLIIEIGTHYGGTSLYMADLLEINGNGIIHTIDITDYVTDKAIIIDINNIDNITYSYYNLVVAESFEGFTEYKIFEGEIGEKL